MTAPTPETLAEVERMLPEWERVEGPMHATRPFHFPVYAKDCRPAVAQAVQSLKDRNAELEAQKDKLAG